MAGWERTGTADAPVWVLEFEHHPGLEVRCTVPSLRARVLANRVAPTLVRQSDDGRALLALAEVFAEDCLLSWNLRWAGQPRACSAAGIARVDETLVAEILHGWISQWIPRPKAEPAQLQPFPELDELSIELLDEAEQPESAPELAVVGG